MNVQKQEYPNSENVVNFPNLLKAKIDALAQSGELNTETLDVLLFEFIMPLRLQARRLNEKLQALLEKDIDVRQ